VPVGLPLLRLHDLRHGAATLALIAGADLATFEDMLGHASIVLTPDTSTNVLPGRRPAGRRGHRPPHHRSRPHQARRPAGFAGPTLAPSGTHIPYQSSCLPGCKRRSEWVRRQGLEPRTR